MDREARRFLHSENFELCRICLREPESHMDMDYFHIFGVDDSSENLRAKMFDVFNDKIEGNDVKPKIICSKCHASVVEWYDLRKKTVEAQIVVNYIVQKRFSSTSLVQSTSGVGSSSDSKINTVSTTAYTLPSYPQTQLKLPHSETRPVSLSQPNRVARQFLHSENFDLCRICLREPESHMNLDYFPIFGDIDRSEILRIKIFEVVNVKIEGNDVRPKLICSKCYASVLEWYDLKKTYVEAQIVINYIVKKRFSPTTSIQSTPGAGSLSDSKNNILSTTASELPSYPQTKLQLPQSETRPVSQPNSYTSSSQQDRSTVQPFIANNSTPVEAHESDDNSSCYEVPIPEEVIYISSDSEVYEVNFKQNPSGIDVVRYCSICMEDKKYNHVCSLYNKEFSTCLVPNCYSLFRTLKDFDVHYRQHKGFSHGECTCLRCFREIKKSECDANGRHICCNTENVLKCYACNIVLNSMAELAWHNLQMHNGQLRDSSGNFLCFYCENSSPDNMYMKNHTKQMHYKKDQINEENKSECETKHKKPKVTETVVTTNDKSVINKPIDSDSNNVYEVKHSYKLLLFTCLKQSCNLVFPDFKHFKFHHREHFNTGSSLLCWQCFTTFNSVSSLRLHQIKDNCQTPGMFKCFECSVVLDDIECFSVHKYTVHNGQLVIQKKGLLKNTVMCPSCISAISTDNFKSHLIQCYTHNGMKSNEISSSGISVPKNKDCSSSKCGVCGKFCLTKAALCRHIKIHNPKQTKSSKTNKVNSINCDLGFVEENKNTNSTPESSSKNNESSEFVDLITDYKSFVSNLTSSKSNACESATLSSVDYTNFPFADGVYSCIQCPKKFTTKMGLAKHWPICSPKKMVHTKISADLKTLPKNYYCSDCKEYFTRIDFRTHFKVVHGKVLGLNKMRRLSCTKCPLKFIYTVALLMHYEHAHGEKKNTEKNTTGTDDGLKSVVNDSVSLPVLSETTSLATDSIEESVREIEEIYDQRIKKEVNDTTFSNAQWEDDDGMISARSATENVEMKEEHHDFGSEMEIGNTSEIKDSIEVIQLAKNNEAYKLDENREANDWTKTRKPIVGRIWHYRSDNNEQ